MDRAEAVKWSERAGVGRDPVDEFVLPSRGEVIATLACALDASGGPVLLTGEPGVGKSWLCRNLRADFPSEWRWVTIDLSPAIVAGELYALISHAMGVARGTGPAESRALLGDVLEDAAANGERWGLIVEEVHDAPAGVLEELRILGNRMGEPGAFAGLILVGQSALARRLTLRSLAPLDVRIAAREHLRPLDVDELRAWLKHLAPDQAVNEHDLERLHRETAGNPRRVLAKGVRRLAPKVAQANRAPFPVVPRRGVELAAIETPEKVATAAPERSSSWDAPVVAPVKPPLQVGDGMIEVGWEATAEPLNSSRIGPDARLRHGFAPTEPGSRVGSEARDDGSEEVIDDRYAALQAWTEWARNQGREPVVSAIRTTVERDESLEADDLLSQDLESGLDPDENPSARISGLSGVRAEGNHEFAPYSQLFSRLRETRDSQ